LNVSYFITAERNIATIVGLLKEMRSEGVRRVDVKEEAFNEYNSWMAGRFPTFSWGSADCHSYYRNASGHAPFLFPGSFKEYRRLHEATGLHDYELA